MKLLSTGKLGLHLARLIQNPDRLTDVIAVADLLTNTDRAIEDIVDALREAPGGTDALRARPRIGPIDVDALRKLEAGTLGRALADYAERAGLDLSALPTRPAHDNRTFVEAHLFETHDVWHVVTGFGTDVAGELGLLTFYLAQFPSRLGIVLVGAGLLQTWWSAFDERDARMDEIVRGWLLGRRAQPLLGVDWKTEWRTPLADLRARFGIDADAVSHIVDRVRPRGRA